MSNLLRELASGPAALPRNSEIVLFNALTTAQQQQVISLVPSYGLNMEISCIAQDILISVLLKLRNRITWLTYLQRLADCSRVSSAVGIRHVQGNPLNRSDMAHKIDIGECVTMMRTNTSTKTCCCNALPRRFCAWTCAWLPFPGPPDACWATSDAAHPCSHLLACV